MIEGSSRWDGLWLALGLVLCAPGCTDAKIFRCANGTPTLVGSSYVCETSDAGSDAAQDAGSDAGQDASADAGSDAATSDGGWPTCAQTLTRVECVPASSACGTGEACLPWFGRNYCRKTCTFDSDCTSVHAASRCIEYFSGQFGCSTPCQPGDDTTCPVNQTCSWNSDPNRGSPNVFTECRDLNANGAAFSGCQPANTTLCAPNSTCAQSNDATNTPGTTDSRCLPQCRIGHDEDCASVAS
ncbi:MAG: hypothetical protein U0230_28120, partial [Polyangiales bacterium]